jgi:hypothetical protein
VLDIARFAAICDVTLILHADAVQVLRGTPYIRYAVGRQQVGRGVTVLGGRPYRGCRTVHFRSDVGSGRVGTMGHDAGIGGWLATLSCPGFGLIGGLHAGSGDNTIPAGGPHIG